MINSSIKKEYRMIGFQGMRGLQKGTARLARGLPLLPKIGLPGPLPPSSFHLQQNSGLPLSELDNDKASCIWQSRLPPKAFGSVSSAQAILDKIMTGNVDADMKAAIIRVNSKTEVPISPQPSRGPLLPASLPYQKKRFFSSLSASSDAILTKLLEGNKRFRQRFFPQKCSSSPSISAGDPTCKGKDAQLYQKLQNGQHPHSLIVGCIDSRVPVEEVFDAEPGESLVIRNVANIIPCCEKDTGKHGVSAGLQFAVKHVKVKHIIILGHESCGGVAALLDDDERQATEEDFILPWVRTATQAKRRTLLEMPHASREAKIIQCGKYSLENSLENLLTFSFVQAAVQRGELSIHAWYFNLKTGEVEEIAHSEKHPYYNGVVILRRTMTGETIKEVPLPVIPLRPSIGVLMT
jgi:carbonic anhydrase